MAPVPSSNETPDLTGIDYAKYFSAGGLCAMLTHGAVTPMGTSLTETTAWPSLLAPNVVKTRIQLDPKLGKLGMVGTARGIIAEESVKGLFTGFGATAVGYLVQGGAKFAGYEFWKKKFVDAQGGYEAATPNRTTIYLGSAAIAEFFADVSCDQSRHILLTPLEAVRIRTVSDRTYASGLATGFLRMAREGGVSEMYAGFVPILVSPSFATARFRTFKQIPFALGQFVTNEWAHETVYKQLSAEKRKNLSVLEETGITLGCGVVAGISAAVLSHPADTLLSQINKGKGGKGGIFKRLGTLASEAGPAGLFSGLGPRVVRLTGHRRVTRRLEPDVSSSLGDVQVMTAGLVSAQFFLYGTIKKSLGARPGIEIHKAD
ncbi:BZ3500_MvSof-1268-A1-R1_Chr3-1g05720 [Microbotryum saponariae]|uniref:BZ3500_MvSof-1268-A1-R1_Chr3-1g05720 protein n=1 Tax=Microbotryum saponariae TaxID=289078 RepID=A0A2X0LI94_9BASI|nr:BZ3500_MvSof-1268-A1-R1_Chr3-1g05720 [Microbotryum saponariae]SDA04910.1 BZ3501_MvSof-1269-A2-R1_Chr3-1g05390 [Microbotryum saponariae]